MKNLAILFSIFIFPIISFAQLPSLNSQNLNKAKNLGNKVLQDKKKKKEEDAKEEKNTSTPPNTSKADTTKKNNKVNSENSGQTTTVKSESNEQKTEKEKNVSPDFFSKQDPKKKNIDEVRMPKAVMKNEKIEKDLLILSKEDYGEEVIPQRAVIDASDWTIIRNDLGVITEREIPGYVAVKVKRNGYCFYKKMHIYQPYTGGGNYGKSQYYDTGVSTDMNEIKCENVFK